MLTVNAVKSVKFLAVNVDKSNYIAPAQNGNDNFAAGKTAAGNVSRELLNIGNNDAFLAFPRRPAPCRTEYGCMRPDPEKGPVPTHHL